MILFRCDSSFDIGAGHVTRCLNLAALIRINIPEEKIEFVCLDLLGNISQKVVEQGYVVHKDMPSLENCSWLVVDHYGLDEVWEKTLPKNVKIFVIDDLVNRKHFCHVLLDQNYRSEKPIYEELVPEQCRLLLGPHYSLLNPSLHRATSPKKFSLDFKILCFFGGTDEKGFLLKLARSLMAVPTNFKFTLVALSSHQHLPELLMLKLPKNVDLQIDPKNWHDLLHEADFYFGSGGTVTWERMFAGLPGAVLSIAHNQEGPSQQLAYDGFQFYWGSAFSFNFDRTIEKLVSATNQIKVLEKMSASGIHLVDRIGHELIKEIFST
jgi:UDP-2,4-diacetamido-2,4,6-trideoxy-beta-L-altropyranose hydrolase